MSRSISVAARPASGRHALRKPTKRIIRMLRSTKSAVAASLRAALFAVCAIGLASPAYAASIQIADAEAIFEADENTFEVFMTITNSGATADSLYAVKSKVAKSSRLNVSSIEEEHALEAKGEEAVQATALPVEPGQPLILSDEGALLRCPYMDWWSATISARATM